MRTGDTRLRRRQYEKQHKEVAKGKSDRETGWWLAAPERNTSHDACRRMVCRDKCLFCDKRGYAHAKRVINVEKCMKDQQRGKGVGKGVNTAYFFVFKGTCSRESDGTNLHGAQPNAIRAEERRSISRSGSQTGKGEVALSCVCVAAPAIVTLVIDAKRFGVTRADPLGKGG